MIDAGTFDVLLSPLGQRALADATALSPTDSTLLACVGRLRKSYPADLAAAAIETAILRTKAEAKFTRADRMYFTREALEVASGEVVSRYRAERFRRFEMVADLGCGIGGDSIGLTAAGVRVVAVDRDEVRVRMTAANLAAYDAGSLSSVQQSDLLADPLPDVPAAFADPGRRADGKRFLSVRDYLPPPAELLKRLPPGHPVGFKLAPGVPLDELAAFGGEAEAEFISVGGELKECVLWLGELRTAERRATVMNHAGSPLALVSGSRPAYLEPQPISAFLYDPDPAVTRSGLVSLLAEQLDSVTVDAVVQLLTRETHQPTPFATAYRVDAVVPADAKRVIAALRSLDVGRVTPVNRGWPGELPPTRRWKLGGSGHRFVIFTREMGKPVAVIGDRIV
jgi:SAM-dependent methyltransferase